MAELYETDEIWALWPDCFMCEKHDIPQMNHRSDDYQLVRVTQTDLDGNPMKWEPLKGRPYEK
jgi:hypothetical protein